MNPSEPHDRELLARFTHGDDAALGMLAGRYEAGMLGLARSLLQGRADLAADAVQDTWLRVIRSARTYSGEASVKTWLYRILVNRCHDLRLQAARHALQKRGSGGAHPISHPMTRDDGAFIAHGDRVESASAEPGPEERDPSLQRALDALPEERRAILVLCYHRGLTHEVAAGVLGIPVGTLKSRLNAALIELRAALATNARHERQPA